jgi:hypothetical protein
VSRREPDVPAVGYGSGIFPEFFSNRPRAGFMTFPISMRLDCLPR